MNLFDLTGRIAVVTGGGTGIGCAIAEGLASHGATVVLAGRRQNVVQAAAEKIAGRGGTAEAVVLDVTDGSAIREVMQGVRVRHGRLDILVNNAGINRRMPYFQLEPTDWEAVLDTNLKGAFFCAQAAAKIMVEQRSGKIINVASLQSEMAARNAVAYAASKGGMRQMTKGLAAELAGFGITVNAIGPGWPCPRRTTSPGRLSMLMEGISRCSFEWEAARVAARVANRALGIGAAGSRFPSGP